MNSSSHPSSQRLNWFWSDQGLSIMEILVSLLIISLGIVGLGMAIPAGKESAEKVEGQRTALFLAKQMMEEIQSKAYEDPESSQGSFGREEVSRNTFDDVDDYDEWLAENPPQYPDGTLMDGQNGGPDFRDFSRIVEVKNVADDNYSNIQADGSTASKRITVKVSSAKDPKSFDDVVITWAANREGMDLLYKNSE